MSCNVLHNKAEGGLLRSIGDVVRQSLWHSLRHLGVTKLSHGLFTWTTGVVLENKTDRACLTSTAPFSTSTVNTCACISYSHCHPDTPDCGEASLTFITRHPPLRGPAYHISHTPGCLLCGAVHYPALLLDIAQQQPAAPSIIYSSSHQESVIIALEKVRRRDHASRAPRAR